MGLMCPVTLSAFVCKMCISKDGSRQVLHGQEQNKNTGKATPLLPDPLQASALQMLTHRVPTTLCHGWDHELTLSMRRQAPGNQVADLN